MAHFFSLISSKLFVSFPKRKARNGRRRKYIRLSVEIIFREFKLAAPESALRDKLREYFAGQNIREIHLRRQQQWKLRINDIRDLWPHTQKALVSTRGRE